MLYEVITPIASGESKLLSICTRPISVPIIPKAGAAARDGEDGARVGLGHLILGGEDDDALDEVLELAHVAWVVVGTEELA